MPLLKLLLSQESPRLPCYITTTHVSRSNSNVNILSLLLFRVKILLLYSFRAFNTLHYILHTGNVLSCSSQFLERCVPKPSTVVPKVWSGTLGSHFKTLSEGPQGQKCLQNTKLLFSFLTLTFS